MNLPGVIVERKKTGKRLVKIVAHSLEPMTATHGTAKMHGGEIFVSFISYGADGVEYRTNVSEYCVRMALAFAQQLRRAND
jgi:hypothetical protein